MRPQKVLDNEILDGLSQVFRLKGYEGASLKDLSDATGLKKASLYHRFPNGKREMANAVLSHIEKWVDKEVFTELLNLENTPEIRLREGLNKVRILYNGGNETCIFRALSLQPGLELFLEEINNGMSKWISAFEHIGLSFGLTPTEAKNEATRTLIKIQGSLIVSKGLNNIDVFENALLEIENTYSKS